MQSKLDFKKTMKTFFYPPVGEFSEIDLPKMRFVMVDGAGDPNSAKAYGRALEWLYSTSYAMKFSAKNNMNCDYVVPPLEGLWWAEDPLDFVRRRKSTWLWTMLIMVPEFVTDQMFEAARENASKKLGKPPETLRLATLHEGLCLQTTHIGSYDDEGPTLARLHDSIMPERGWTFNGPHHEIYLSDPRRVAKDRLRTVLRQPVKPIQV
ncbi:GyrI-like domain-containing protein [Nitratireductor sp. ac15]